MSNSTETNMNNTSPDINNQSLAKNDSIIEENTVNIKPEKKKTVRVKPDKAKHEKKLANKATAEKNAEKKKAEKAKAELEKAEKKKVEKEKTEKKKAEKAKTDKEKAEKAKTDKEAKAEKAKADKEAKAEKAKADKEAKAEKVKADKVAKSEKKLSDKAKTDKKKTEKIDSEKGKDEKKATTKKVNTKNKSNDKTKKAEAPSKKSSNKKPGENKWNIKSLGGLLFAKMLRGGASELHANAEEVNKLNVFPVPDGDTGDNMSMTIESGVASLDNIDTDDLAEVLRVASKGMLLGARGNSGVILSQFFAGMAKGVENVENADAKKLAKALELGVQQAYGSVMTPTEGTILTVAREAVEFAVSRVTSKSTVQSLFSDLVNEMHASLERTPEILPILGEAGVVDSGGAGLLYIIDGLNRVLNGEAVDDTEITRRPKPKTAAIEENTFGPDSDMDYGYCTELLVQLMNKKIKDKPFDIDALKVFLASIGDSIVAFQTETIVKIHVHTLRPDKVLQYMRKFGEFITIKIENMSLQHTEMKEEEKDTPAETETVKATKKIHGIVMVSSGDGISELFRDLGADEIVSGGQTNNPSTNDFIDAFSKINADNIFVFPNNSNIIMAASQAAEIYENAKIFVIPTKSMGAGYVAVSTMGFDMTEDPEALVAEAQEAIGRITSAYISPAVRDVDMNGVRVTEGDTMGIIEKEIVISGPDKIASTLGLVDTLLSDTDKYMFTVFCGKDSTPEEKDVLEQYIVENHPNVEAYFIDGGQEIYPFLFVAE